MSDSNVNNQNSGLEIAIVGMAGRFPGAKNPDELWRNLRQGVEATTFFTDEELEASGVPRALLKDEKYVKAKAMLEDVDLFDAAFFGYNPRESEVMDPQQRLFLECSWEALESAGYTPETYRGKIGVYAGLSMSRYLLHLYANQNVLRTLSGTQIIISNDKDHLPTRVSYKLDLRGPSVNVQTACSTSLVAVHLACQSLLSGECNMALAGGASIDLPQKAGYYFQEGGIDSPDGRCRAFDEKAQGTIGGSGVGIVVLKRLDDALADGDFIHAVIKGSAINNDGSLKVGYTAPSEHGQAQAIRSAQLMAEVDAASISYIEAHGTGTSLGDPIEIAALTKAFRASTERKQFCAVGSLKTNIGHLDAAAGVAGLIKTVLALRHREIPPSLHYEQPNPKIDFANSPFFVNSELRVWERNGTPRRAGVSSFGIGGTNAHVVVEEAPEVEAATGQAEARREREVLVLSAKTEQALERMTERLVEHLRGEGGERELGDIAYTLQVGRSGFKHRRMVVSGSIGEAREALSGGVGRESVVSGEAEGKGLPVFFMFPGQGTQHVNMGRELYETETRFRETLDMCAEALKEYVGEDIRALLYPATKEAEEAAGDRLAETRITQPALFAVEYALAQLWLSWGVRPQAMIGHSLGEYVAACLAGVMTLEEALRLVAKRGQLIQQVAHGAMLAVPLAESELRAMLPESLSLSAVNGAALCTVAGTTEAVEEFEHRLRERGVSGRRLRTSHAFHSRMMEQILQAFAQEVKKVNLKAPAIPFVSNVTGELITAEQATDPSYWARHLRETVRFADGVEQLLQQGRGILLEVGPGHTLSNLARQHARKENISAALSSLPRPTDAQSPVVSMLHAAGRLWVAGGEIDWTAVHDGAQRKRLPLPTYPFERQRYWVDAPRANAAENGASAGSNGFKHANASGGVYFPTWKRSVASNVNADKGTKHRWLVFMDECGLGEQVVAHLALRGEEVVGVRRGDSFARLSGGEYTINASHAGDYETLCRELAETDMRPQKVVHLWGVTGSESHDAKDGFQKGLEEFTRGAERGLNSIYMLARALGADDGGETVQIEVVTNGLQEVSGEESLCPEKATVLGACQVIPQEYANLRCRSVDIELGGRDSRREQHVVSQLTNEARRLWDATTEVVAYRGAHRWIQTFEPVSLANSERDVEADANAAIREDGVYLITDGQFEVQSAIARNLAQSTPVKLVLFDSQTSAHDAENGLRSDGLELNAGEDDSRQEIPEKIIQVEMEQLVDVINQYEERIEGELQIKSLAYHDGFREQADELCASHIISYFTENGIEVSRGNLYHVDELRQRLRILPKFEKFFEFMLRTLVEDALVEIEDGVVKFLKSRDELAPTEMLKEAILRLHPEFKGKIELMEYCVKNYDRALTGEVNAISVLYPDGTSSFLNQGFKDSDTYCQDKIYLTLMREVVRKLLDEAQGRKLRILEIGGGDGDLTRTLVPLLLNRNVEYHFTDLGKSFVRKAQREAVKYGLDFMRFGVFDISKDPARQGYDPRSFDLVVALNVVHATRNLRETVRNLKRLISPNGIMGLIEVVSLPRWDTMVWGLAEGWWYFEDSDVRKESPLLKLGDWEQLLNGEGFKSVRAYSQNEYKRLSSDHGLILAQQNDLPDTNSVSAFEHDGSAARRRPAGKFVRELENLGSEVLVVNADVSDRPQMLAAIDQIRERFGEPNGVFHTIPASHETADEAVDNPGIECSRQIMGTLVLDDVLKKEKLDFFALVSSSNSTNGDSGQLSNLASVAFLDAFTRRDTNGDNRRTVSIVLENLKDPKTAGHDVKHHGASSNNGNNGHSNGNGNNGHSLAKGLASINAILSQTDAASIIIAPQRRPSTNGQRELNTSVTTIPTTRHEAESGVEETSAESMHARPLVSKGYVAPRNSTEERIAAIWQELLGIETIGVHDDFFELGGESLLALQLVSMLQKTFNVELSLNKVLELPTVEQLSGLVIEDQTQLDLPVQPAEPARSTVLIEVQRGKPGRSPFVFIHPTGGGLFGYRDLAHHLGEDQPVYGMQPRGLNGLDSPFNKIEDMALYYLNALRERQPEGPYLLGGASFGGAVAFEMAQQLFAQGQKVALLTLFDTPAPSQIPAKPVDGAAILDLLVGNKINLSLDELRALSPDDQLAYVLEQAQKANMLSSHMELSVAKHVLHIWKANAEALLSYQPQTYDGRIVFFRAGERNSGLPEFPEQPWIEIAAKGLEVHVVPGGHESMLRPPHVETLAKRLRNCLNEAQLVV